MTSPLIGIRVVEISAHLAGPLAATRLADAGAEVVKIEDAAGDPARQYGGALLGDLSAVFVTANRGKRLLHLDLTVAKELERLASMLETADVLVCDLAELDRSSLTRLRGIDLDAVNPRLVTCVVSRFGERGPWRDRPGSELISQFAADIPNLLGEPGGVPLRVGADIAATNTAIFAVQGIVAALLQREETGRGERVFVDEVGSLLHTRGTIWAIKSAADEWESFHLNNYSAPPERGYRTRTDNIYFLLRSMSEDDFSMLMIALRLEVHLGDPRFDNGGRDAAPLGKYAREVAEIWEAGFAAFRAEELVDLIVSLGGDAVAFNDAATVVEHPQVRALGIVSTVEHSLGSWRQLSPAITMSGSPLAIRSPTPVVCGPDGLAEWMGEDSAG